MERACQARDTGLRAGPALECIDWLLSDVQIPMIVDPDSSRHFGASPSSGRGPVPFLSIVVPALNEEQNVDALADHVCAALDAYCPDFELIFVSDGSSDATCLRVSELHARDPRFKLLHLSRTFGHQPAILAGLDHARGRVVITMDADLQHPPAAIPELLARWQAGADVVHAVRKPTRIGSPFIRRCKRVGYGLLRRLCEVDIIPGSADFRLYDRRAVRAMRMLREQNRFNRGLARWIGFAQDTVYIDEQQRYGGVAKYSFFKLLRLLMNGVFSLSSKPLQYVGIGGLVLSMLSSCYLVLVVGAWVFNLPGYRAISGWPSTIAAILFMGGIQLTAIWLMAQYLARTYDEVKRRPPYLVARSIGLECDALFDESRDSRVIPRQASGAPVAAVRERVAELVAHVR
ncbi:MAG: glycosyltransferase family 2 protein [Phycisphaerales bacterium]|nr:glycosyltransferase family 2 protein [Phycisphaerales bacterium]